MASLIKTMWSEVKEPVDRKIMWFGLFGIFLQVFTFALRPETSILSLISGLLGVYAVVLTSQRKLSAYIPAFLQLGTYMILAWRQRFYGELGENIFYFITMIFGLFIWSRNYNNTTGEVKSRNLGKNNIILGIFTALGIGLLWMILRGTDDTQPFMDSITTIPAFVAQILMILRYREQWIYWIIIDLASIVMWWRAGDFCMVAQFVFWTMNCILGWKLWRD